MVETLEKRRLLAGTAPQLIEGYVYVDANNNGIKDGGATPEQGIPGVVIHLDGFTAGPRPVAVHRTWTTDSTGYYFFDGPLQNVQPGLLAGTYTLTEEHPSSYLDGKDSIGEIVPYGHLGTVTVIPGSSNGSDTIPGLTFPDDSFSYQSSNNNFGELLPGKISGKVYADTNDDGTPQGIEAGIPSVSLTLTGIDDLGNPVLLTTTTNGSGDYSFTNLRPGTYTVTETPPAGYFDGLDANGGVVIAGSRATDVVTPIVLAAGGHQTNNNFGELLAASLSGYVYVDADNDGNFLGADSPISGATIDLTGTDDLGNPVSQTTTTDATGLYQFLSLRPGTYTITETQPVGYLDGKDTIGTPGGTTANDVFSTIVLGAAINGVDNNFGEFTLGTISGKVYVDTNDDGIPNGAETGIPTVALTLTGTDDLGNPVLLTTTTNINGDYSFTNLRPGTYTVIETPPAGYFDGLDANGGVVIGGSRATDFVTPIVLGVGDTQTNNNFGELLAASLSGYVYFDANNDGIFQGTESPIPNATVKLTGTDDLGNAVLLSTTTNAAGLYQFAALRPGTYRIAETQPVGYLDGEDTIGTPGGTITDDVFDEIELDTGFDGVDNNFGELLPGTISGKVYADSNDDGTPNGIETGISTVTLMLTGTDDLGNSVVLTTATDSNGDYSFTNLRPGTYSVTETPPAGYFDGLDANGGVVIVGSRTTDEVTPIVLDVGGNETNNNFGELLAASLAGYVYIDANNDGLFQGTETPITSVAVSLTGTDDLGVAVSLTATTNAVGLYEFTELRPGTYTITEAQPVGYLDGKDTLGTPGGTTANDVFSSIALGAGIIGVNNNFGELKAGTISGKVYSDTNNDGTPNGVETEISGVLLTLTGTDIFGNSVTSTTTTDAHGNYSFTNLRPGTYSVTETHPVGYYDGLDAKGGVVITGSRTTDVVMSIALASGETKPNNNFGELLPASLSGYVYVDASNDGIFQATEFPISNVTVTLTGTDYLGNAVTQTATTDGTGKYNFNNLRPGTYKLTETQPATYLDGVDTIGTQGGTAANDVFSAIPLGAGVNGINNNFGERKQASQQGTASLSGYVYVDANNDGIKQAAELPIAGVTVTLTGTNDLGDAVSLSTSANAVGLYQFTGLRAGTYKITEAQPAAYLDGKDTVGSVGGTMTNDMFSAIALLTGVAGINYNFGEIGSTVCGTKYFDITGNGYSSDDTPMAGAKFTLYLDQNTGTKGSLDGGDVAVGTVQSLVNGTFAFGSLAAGKYFLEENPLTGYIQTGPVSLPYYTINVTVGSQTSGYVFANAELGCECDINTGSISYLVSGPGITGTKTVSDLRGNTFQGDTVQVKFYVTNAGSTFSLVSYTAPGSSFDPNTASQQTIFDVAVLTNATVGWHTLNVVIPNCNYQVDFVCGYPIDHFGPAGSNIFYSPQQRLFSADNGGSQQCAASSLSGFTYVDTNNNGVKDSGEAPIAGTKLTLTGTDIYGNAVSRTTTTNSSGAYTFSNLTASGAAGYTITETQPAGYLDGKDTIGSLGGTAGNDVLVTTRVNTNVNGTNYNFGELLPASVSGYVYVDANNDGIKQSTETIIAGVTVKLTGTDDRGNAVSLTTTTNASGLYQFSTLRPGTYKLTETQPVGYMDGKDTIGSQGGTMANDVFSSIVLKSATAGVNNNFGEKSAALTCGDTATIGYWQNANGQALIKCLNGGSSSTALAKWLATTYPNLYGASAGTRAMVSSSGVYKTNAQVASSYITNFFNVSGTKTDAQVLAAALATYVTKSTLAGSSVASSYGFTVTSTGSGAKFFNVGANGASFGVANNTSMTVAQMLAYANSKSRNGVLYSEATTLRTGANVAFTGVNETGDIN